MSLPSDTTSVENAVVVDVSTSIKSRRWALMIDPQVPWPDAPRWTFPWPGHWP